MTEKSDNPKKEPEAVVLETYEYEEQRGFPSDRAVFRFRGLKLVTTRKGWRLYLEERKSGGSDPNEK